MKEREETKCRSIGVGEDSITLRCPSMEEVDKVTSHVNRTFGGWICGISRADARHNIYMVTCDYEPIQEFDGWHLVWKLEKQGTIKRGV